MATYSKSLTVAAKSAYTLTMNSIPTGSSVTPVNDIQTWLHCADIWSKTYTTINQVLADAPTLQALIASNNAADYMVRSTNWASSVCANATAMGYIGNNNYCANKLLSNSTWRTAICNSTYFELVLNVKVPTMTSNTTPSGVAGVIDTPWIGQAYFAFDKDNSNVVGGGNNKNYLGVYYKFTQSVCVRKVTILPSNYNVNGGFKAYKIQGSNDNSNYTDLYSGTHENAYNELSINLSNTTSYLYYRFYAYDGTWDSGNRFTPNIAELQFYGRA